MGSKVPNTFIKITSVTVGSGGSANIEFTSIPQTYTDLKIVMSARTSTVATSESCKMTFNGNTTNYSTRYLFADGSTPSSGSSGSPPAYVFRVSGANATASVFGNGEVYIPNYASSKQKSFNDDSVAENNGSLTGMILTTNLFSNTTAITSIKIEPIGAGTFQQYSTATLYGIKSS